MNTISKIFLKNQKCLEKYLNKLFCFRGFQLKCNFQCELSKSSGFQRKHPPLTPPPLTHGCAVCRGVGEKWIFFSSSRSFSYGFEVVRIRDIDE
jgi:hypothetical protein